MWASPGMSPEGPSLWSEYLRTGVGTAQVDTLMRPAALTAIVLVGAACGASENHGPTRTPLRDAEALRAAPSWVRAFCREASSVIRGDVLCPGRLPTPFGPGPNEGKSRPSGLGYIFEGYSESHWVIAAFPARSAFEGYGGLRTVGTVRIAGRAAGYLFTATGGIFADHQILSWRRGGFVYAVSVHTGKPKWQAPPELLQVALAMRQY
jgi:hypothetical protein